MAGRFSKPLLDPQTQHWALIFSLANAFGWTPDEINAMDVHTVRIMNALLGAKNDIANSRNLK